MIEIALRSGVSSLTETTGEDIIFLSSTCAAGRFSATIFSRRSHSVTIPTGRLSWVTQTLPTFLSRMSIAACQALWFASIVVRPGCMNLLTGSSSGDFASVQSIQNETEALQFEQVSGGVS